MNSQVTFKVVIPARIGSTRLKGKPLLMIGDKPMIIHVCERAKEAKAEQILVATDDRRILDVVHDYGFEAVMTQQHHQNGTERLSEVVKLFDWKNETIVVNLQGDEPLLPPVYITKIANMLASKESIKVATLAAAIDISDDIFNPSCVKVVLDKHQYALYFSRSAIPWERASFSTSRQPSDVQFYLRHIGLYAYTAEFLKQYCQWSASPLEQIESLEQLRILWYGEKILVHTVERMPPASVDTIEDLQRVEKIIANSFF